MGISQPSRRAAMRGVAVTAVVCAALAGCSSGDPEDTLSYTVSIPAAGDAGDAGDVADTGAIPDPCALLTPAGIAAASGLSFADGVFNASQSTDTQSVCEWHASSGALPIVHVLVSPGASQVRTQRATAESMMGVAVDVTVPGADDAYAVANGTILGMAVGDYFVQVSYMTTDTADVLAITSAVAAQAAASLS
jgi:hypothetical protein